MMPPLRTEGDRIALVEGLRNGVIDVVATDHAPHAALEKEVPFEYAPYGVLGLEWAASVAASTAGLGIVDFFDRMSTTPARIARLEEHGSPVGVGSPANLVVFDPTVEWTPTTTLSRSRNAPYLGRPLQGMVTATMLRGTITHGSSS